MSTSVQKELTNKGIKPTLYDPRVRERQKLNIPGVQVMQKELGSIHPLIGFSHDIPKNPELLSKINTSKYGPLFIGSPLSFHLSALEFKTEFTRGPGRGDTCHLSFLNETLPD